MAEPVRIACCQIVPEVEDPARSQELALAAVTEALAAGAQIVVLPELVTSGYVFISAQEARAAATPADGPVLRAWAQAVRRCDAIVVGGFCELGSDGQVYNSSALVDGSGVLGVYRKLHLWNEEALWFAPGQEPAPVVATRYGQIGLGICYDIEFPELTRGLALAGADLIALPTNWPRDEAAGPEQIPIVRLLAITTAYLSRVFVAVCDRGGNERGSGFEGASTIVAAGGSVVAASGRSASAELLLADCDFSQARDKSTGSRNDAFADRRPEHYRYLSA